MAVAFYFCTQKQGFHEDEYYTYYSTARTAGFYVEDGKWMERDAYRNEFVVLPEQRFQYGLVKLVQSWDVHPPVYYWVFHTAASLFPGVFSKWIGLSINLFFHGINILLLTYVSYLVGGRNEKLSLLVTLFYGFTPAAMSGAVFIRMYEMLTTFVLLCAALHVKEVCRTREVSRRSGKEMAVAGGKGMERDGKKNKLSWGGFLIPMMAVTYLGFLTQYYYFIFMFYMAIAFCVYLLRRDRKIWNCLRYGVTQGAAFVLAYLTYPVCLGQMFRGQRGAQATGNFFDWSNTLERFTFFFDLLNEYVFGKMLPVFLLIIIMLIVTERMLKRLPNGRTADDLAGADVQAVCRISLPENFWILLFAVAGYFLTVSKTALLLGDTSNRYQLPVYGMIVLLVFWAAKNCADNVGAIWSQVRGSHVKSEKKSDAGSVCALKKGRSCVIVTLIVICLAIDLAGLLSDRVVFLYPEDEEQVAFARQQAQKKTPAVYLYGAGEDWCAWDISNELFEYPAVYFAVAEGTAGIKDEKIASADALVVYLAKGVDTDEQLARIMDSNKNLKEYELCYEEKYCAVYRFD